MRFVASFSWLFLSASVLFTAPAAANDDPVSAFFASIFASHESQAPSVERHSRSPSTVGGGDVQKMIASQVSAHLGPQWVSPALRIAKIESGFRCNARNGRAVGVFQTTHPESFGVSRAAAMTCKGGIEAGISHMQMCLDKGARTSWQMMTCHNTGSPFSRRVERAYLIARR